MKQEEMEVAEKQIWPRDDNGWYWMMDGVFSTFQYVFNTLYSHGLKKENERRGGSVVTSACRLFQKNHLLFPASTSDGSQPHITPAPGHLTPLVSVDTCTYAYTLTCTIKNNYFLDEKEISNIDVKIIV